MQTTWILTADGSRARIFETTKRLNNRPDPERNTLHEVHEFISPKAHQQEQEINTSPKGRFANSSGQQQAHTSEPRVDPATHEMEIFTKALSAYIEKARNEHRFDKLRVIASPKMLGLMRQNLSKEAMKLVEEEIAKDISWFDKREIEQYLAQHDILH